MTVVPDENSLTLICDTCGDMITGNGPLLPDTEVVWTLVTEQGWTGSPFSTGPHRCPRCGLFPTATDAGAGAGAGAGRNGYHGRAGAVSGIDYLDEVAIVAVVGDIDVDACESLRSALHTAIDVSGYVVVDLTEVHLIDSTALGLLVRGQREARRRGAELCLAAPSRFILTVLHTMRLDCLFPIFTSRSEAIAQLFSRRQPYQSSVPRPVLNNAHDDAPRRRTKRQY